MLASTIGFVACLALELVWCQDISEGQAVLDPRFPEMIFTESLLYERRGTSKIRCAGLCMKTDGCVTFTFTPAGGVCRGHSARMSLFNAHDDSVGTKLYAVPEDDWMDTACVSDQECSQANSRCRRSKCTCNQGYYYSVSTKACLDSCSLADLQDTYLPYPNAVTWDGVGRKLKGLSLEECKQKCTDKRNCLNFEMSVSVGSCYLVAINPRDKSPTVWKENMQGWTYYQRNCY